MTGSRCSRRKFLVAASVSMAGIAGCSGPGMDPENGKEGGVTGSSENETKSDDSKDSRMVSIEGGEYTIGVDEGTEAAQPAHTVEIGSFAIDRYEVTNTEYVEFLNSLGIELQKNVQPGSVKGSYLPQEWRDRLIEGREGSEKKPFIALDDEHCRIGVSDGKFFVKEGFGMHPVNEVTWYGARRYAQWRGVRLPTEAEWEAAARGKEERKYPWGNSKPTKERAVYRRSSNETARVNSYPEGTTPNGIHHMAGNVSEWTSSLFRPYPYDADDGRENPDVEGERVTRGGAHVFFGPEGLTTYQRTGFSREVDRGHRHIGFRCAKSVR